MRYDEVERAVRSAAEAAAPADRNSMMTYAVARLARPGVAEPAVDEEFTAEAARVFRQACAEATDATAETLDRHLAMVDAGTLSDGDMDHEVMWALSALEARRDFLLRGDPELVASVAIGLLEIIDFRIRGAEIDDFLADPEMLAQYQTILALLAGDEPVPGDRVAPGRQNGPDTLR